MNEGEIYNPIAGYGVCDGSHRTDRSESEY